MFYYGTLHTIQLKSLIEVDLVLLLPHGSEPAPGEKTVAGVGRVL